MCAVCYNRLPPFDLFTLLPTLPNKSQSRQHGEPTDCMPELFSYLVPSHLWLLVWSQVIFNIRAAHHFALSYLSFLHVAHFAAEALPLVTGLYGHWHRHFHAVGGVPGQIQIPNTKVLSHWPNHLETASSLLYTHHILNIMKQLEKQMQKHQMCFLPHSEIKISRPLEVPANIRPAFKE